MTQLATATRKVTTVKVLAANPAVTYTIKIRVRFRAPLKTYTGGTVHADSSYVNVGGTPAADNYETIKLTISDPAATYYLNKGQSGSPEDCVFADYRITVQVKGDATLTLELDTIDNLVPTALVIGEDSVTDPENDVLDDFRGVFAQIDHAETYISVSTTEITGGGVRGFKFGGFSEQVLLNEAEK